MLAVAAALVVGALVVGGCEIGGDDDPGSAPAQGEAVDLDVLVYNVEYGGGPDTDRVIRRVDADVVGVLESYERLPEIAERTGYPYYNTSLQLLSKYPILEPSGGDGLYALLEVEPGYVVPFFNEHLDYVAWGPRALRNGKSVASVVESENEVRTSAMERPMDAMTGLIDDGYPIFLTGDLNEPSTLDYTAETVGTRKGIDRAGAVAGERGAARPRIPRQLSGRAPGSGRRARRHPPLAASASTTSTRRARRPRSTARSSASPAGEDVDIEQSPWTSDHRAVLSSFEVTPVAMPTLVAVDARLRTVGDEITVTYNVAGLGRQRDRDRARGRRSLRARRGPGRLG